MEESFKYQMVSNGSMNGQINVRLPENLLSEAKKYAEKNGYVNVQELVKESLREKIHAEKLTKEEAVLLKKVLEVTKKKRLWRTEKEIFERLK